MKPIALEKKFSDAIGEDVLLLSLATQVSEFSIGVTPLDWKFDGKNGALFCGIQTELQYLDLIIEIDSTCLTVEFPNGFSHVFYHTSDKTECIHTRLSLCSLFESFLRTEFDIEAEIMV